MGPTGLLNSIIKSVAQIDEGRNGLATDGKEHEGRLSYEKGLADASDIFSKVVATNDPKTIMLAEEAYRTGTPLLR